VTAGVDLAGPHESPAVPAPCIPVGDYPEGVEERRLRIHGVEQRVLVAGHGWPVMLFHGIAGSADEWLGVLPKIAQRHRVVAADAPGHGFSEKPFTHRYDIDSYVDSVLGVMDAMGIRRGPVVALSGGGAVALSLALSHPDRVSKLVLVDAAGLGRQVSWSYRLVRLPLARHLFRRSTNRVSVEAFGRRLCYTPARLPDGWVDRRLQIWSSPGAVEAFFSTTQAGISLLGQKVEFSRRLGEIKQPTLIVWGRQDPIIPVAHGIAAARAIPNARLEIFERCGHMPIWEYPDEFAQMVMDFLA
jgi:pimeloyl-ACP methyl ester carboxylesterase